jgi:hypothetical protein
VCRPTYYFLDRGQAERAAHPQLLFFDPTGGRAAAQIVRARLVCPCYS